MAAEDEAHAASSALAGLSAAWRELLDAVYPPRCPVCAAFLERPGACSFHRLPELLPGPRCGRCAAALSEHLPDGLRCAGCRRDPPAFRRAIAVGDYRAHAGLRDWVLALKHRGRADLARELGRTLGRRAPDELAGACLVPVPLHLARRVERGYDQALLLARAAAGISGARVVCALARRRATAPQGAPGAVSRRANVRDAFRPRRAARPRIDGARVWLVDDVLTSGATASECARVLRRMGAAEVGVAVVARAG